MVACGESSRYLSFFFMTAVKAPKKASKKAPAKKAAPVKKAPAKKAAAPARGGKAGRGGRGGKAAPARKRSPSSSEDEIESVASGNNHEVRETN